jgi:hypothetical protein
MRRVATEDTVLGDHGIAAGDKVVKEQVGYAPRRFERTAWTFRG